ncbi:MAG: hypothetical protein ACKVZJ_10890, partial [Phycisphaerales bacterium]
AAELAAIRAREADRPRLATRDGIALGTGAVAQGFSGMGDGLPAPGANVAHLSEPTPIVSDNPGYASAREHAIALKAGNPRLTQDVIAARVGRPRSTVGKWIRDAGIVAA